MGPLLILAEDEKSDLSQVATSHLIRLIIIITVFPFIVDSLYGQNRMEKIDEVLNQNTYELIILIVLSLLIIFIFDKIKVPAALLAGTLVASGLLQITEVASYKLSPGIIDFCLLILGSSVGCRFANKTFGEIGKNALHSFVATFFSRSRSFSCLCSKFSDRQKFLYSTIILLPGGIYEVAVIAIFLI